MEKIAAKILLLIIWLSGCIGNTEVKKQDMVFVEGGEFIMGSTSETIDSLVEQFGFPRGYIAAEYPPHLVTLSPFYIDQHEVTNAEFKRFIDENPQWQKNNIPDSLHNGKYLNHWKNNNFPPEESMYPVVNIVWYAAMAYCSCQHKRLPTEAEWEYVAGNGGGHKIYPWGNAAPDSLKANYAGVRGKAIDVGSYPPNELGVYDLAGNVWEYTLDGWSADYYKQSARNNPVNGMKSYDVNELFRVKSRRVIRGGSWAGAEVNLRITFRDSHPPVGAGNHVGFRCVKEVTASDKNSI